MLSNGVSHLNGHHNGTNGTTLVCESNYEPVSVIDVIPTTPAPKWRDQHAAFTHHIQWIDSDNISHGLTLRSDSLQDILSDLRMVKGIIRQDKQKHTDANPEQPETQSEKVVCKVHGVPMERRVSKRTGGHYFSHKLADRDLCFGRPKA